MSKQTEFAYNLGRLLTEALVELRRTYPTAAFAMAEGFLGDSIGPGETSPHRRDGGHFKRLAQDLVLFIDGKMVVSSEHPAYEFLGTWWESLGPDYRNLRKSGDANHFGVLDKGVA